MTLRAEVKTTVKVEVLSGMVRAASAKVRQFDKEVLQLTEELQAVINEEIAPVLAQHKELGLDLYTIVCVLPGCMVESWRPEVHIAGYTVPGTDVLVELTYTQVNPEIIDQINAAAEEISARTGLPCTISQYDGLTVEQRRLWNLQDDLDE